MNNSIDEIFRPAKEAIDWGDEALVKFEAGIRDFFEVSRRNKDFVTAVTKIDPNTGQKVRKVRVKSDDIPAEMRRDASQALENARNSFDRSIFAARTFVGGTVPEGTQGNYPWSQSPRDLDILLKRREVPEVLWDVIRSHQPYPTADTHAGGNDLIRSVATLVNKKHSIGLVVTPRVDGYRLAISGVINTTKHGSILVGSEGTPDGSPKNEAELFRWSGKTKPNIKEKVALEICFDDASFDFPEPATVAISAFLKQARIVHDSLKACCIRNS